MIIEEKDAKKFSLIVIIAALIIASFLVVRPILLASIGGLILAYVFYPFYRTVAKVVKNKTLSAFIVTLAIVVVIITVLWFLTPLLMQQVFDIYSAIQKVDAYALLNNLFPNVPNDFLMQLSASINGFIGQASVSILEALRSVLIELPKIALNLFVMGFVFFFAMRDAEQLKKFCKGLSPFNDSKEKIIVSHFKTMTDSVLYGQIIAGVVQGSLAGLGLLVFGVKNALVLTILSIFFSIIPFIGPAVIWVPVSIHLFITQPGNAFTWVFVAYNLIIVSLVDNLIRSYLVSRKTAISQAVVMVGMIGGLFIFGILGLIVGPLIMAYLITLLDSFREKSKYSLFKEDSVNSEKKAE